MTKRAQKADRPLVQRPIEEVTLVARDAGRVAFGNPEIAAVLWMEARFHWINENFSSSLGLTDDEFDAVLSSAGRGFEEGIDEYLRAAADITERRAPRLPGVGYWFSEDSSLAYGITADLSVFSAAACDEDALYQRFSARVLAEYDRLAPHVAATRGEWDGDSVEQLDVLPISISMPRDELLYLQVVPAAIERDALLRELPSKVRDFVRCLSRPESIFAVDGECSDDAAALA